MSSFEINKIVGAILTVALVVMVVGIIGDALVNPSDKKAAVVVASAPVVIAKKEQKKLEPIGPILAKADIEKGKKVAKQCASCHTFNKGGKNKIGPALWGVLGRQAGSVADYKYSKAMAGYGKAWSFEEMNGFLIKPKDWIKGTKMSFAGLKNSTDIAAVILNMNENTDSPLPIK